MRSSDTLDGESDNCKLAIARRIGKQNFFTTWEARC